MIPQTGHNFVSFTRKKDTIRKKREIFEKGEAAGLGKPNGCGLQFLNI